MINTKAQGDARVSHIITLPVSKARKGGQHSSDSLQFSEGCDDYTFRKGRDGVWRWAFVSTYGNTSFVSGDAVGASGFNVTDRRSIQHLNELHAQLAR